MENKINYKAKYLKYKKKYLELKGGNDILDIDIAAKGINATVRAGKSFAKYITGTTQTEINEINKIINTRVYYNPQDQTFITLSSLVEFEKHPNKNNLILFLSYKDGIYYDNDKKDEYYRPKEGIFKNANDLNVKIILKNIKHELDKYYWIISSDNYNEINKIIDENNKITNEIKNDLKKNNYQIKQIYIQAKIAMNRLLQIHYMCKGSGWLHYQNTQCFKNVWSKN